MLINLVVKKERCPMSMNLVAIKMFFQMYYLKFGLNVTKTKKRDETDVKFFQE